MNTGLLTCVAALAVAAASSVASAKDIPGDGVTVEDVTRWLQNAGYQARVQTKSNGGKTITSATDGIGFHIDFYDCSGRRCGTIQLYAGFDTKGAFNPAKMNEWNRTKRWARAYVDKTDDPWIEMDVDLRPGGTYELLDDEFATWRKILTIFKNYVQTPAPSEAPITSDPQTRGRFDTGVPDYTHERAQ